MITPAEVGRYHESRVSTYSKRLPITPVEARGSRGAARFHETARAWCTEATTIEPSPTAEATRLIDPDRTSPTAKMPGQLVASGCDNAWEDAGSSDAADTPVRTNPLSSKASAVEPLGVRRGPEHEKHIRNMAGLGLPGNPVAPRNGVQVPVAIQRGDLGVRMHGDAFGRRLDTTDEVVGHGGRQSVAAHQDVHMLGET